MIIVCQKCSSRLQVDETKVQSRPFNIRCPKCNSSIDSGVANAAVGQSAVAVGGSPAIDNSKFEQPTPAPLFKFDPSGGEASSAGPTAEKLVELLSSLVNRPAGTRFNSLSPRPSWEPRRVLVCVPEDNRELVARGLAQGGYQVFVAQDTRQAVERMRANQLDMVLLDSRFDPTEQGPVYVTREVNILRPVQRRRLFFVLLSPSLRTMDAHAAFLNNVNAIVNINDLEGMPKLLEQRLREYNELYKDFNNVTGVSAL
jgi:predicted Zn finger-like uncharacterized protein